jgi:murein DD-endopeptidase MepM/ murein hydrolase activator NlpD
MGKCGKGFTLAFFLISFLCHAEETVTGAEPQGQDYPLIARLDWRDQGFKRLMADVEANRRRVFMRDKSRRDESRESADAIANSLTMYRYVPAGNDNIFSLAARCNIPYSTLASLNRLNHPTMIETGKALLLPSAPGVFVPQEPQFDLEYLLASNHLPPSGGDSAMLTVEGKAGEAGIVFHFFPGYEFNATERAFFLNTGFRFPLRSYRLTSGYGIRQNPVTGNMRLHQGVDLAAPAGTEVYATANGVVTEIGQDPVYGNYIVIKHGDNWASLYGHLQKIGTRLHSTVKSGTLIGWVGSTGQSTGPHLHFELRQNGKARDPDKYLFLPGGR